MGQRNPDRIPLRDRWRHGKTVALMLPNGWEVISKCRTCTLAMQVDLKVVVKVSGPEVSLWNRTAQCRRLLCFGVVDFYAKAPGMDGHQRLVIDDREPDVPAWRRATKSPPA